MRQNPRDNHTSCWIYIQSTKANFHFFFSQFSICVPTKKRWNKKKRRKEVEKYSHSKIPKKISLFFDYCSNTRMLKDLNPFFYYQKIKLVYLNTVWISITVCYETVIWGAPQKIIIIKTHSWYEMRKNEKKCLLKRK